MSSKMQRNRRLNVESLESRQMNAGFNWQDYLPSYTPPSIPSVPSISSTPTLTISDAVVTEGGKASVIVSLSSATSRTVSVNYTTSYGSAGSSDLSKISGTLKFSPGQTEKTLTASIKQDTRVESNETFTIKLSSPKNAKIGDGTATITIKDDDSVTPPPPPPVDPPPGPVDPPPTNGAVLIYSNDLTSLSDLARLKTVTAQGDSTKFNGEEQQYYLDYNANGGNFINGKSYPVFQIADGGLQINAIRASGLPAPMYSSDAPNNFISGAFSLDVMHYGYVSADMKFTSKELQWGAFWLTEPGAPKGTSEIDIAEQWAETAAFGTVASNLLKFGKDWDVPTTFDMSRDTNVDRVVMDKVGAEKWHNYALEWTSTNISVYVDGIKKWTYNPPVGFDKPMIPMFNLATLGSEGSMGVRNIRVYDKKPS